MVSADIQKPREVSKEEFTKWLIKEERINVDLAARFSFPNDSEKRGLLILLREKAPRAPFRQLLSASMSASNEVILRNIAVYERHGLPIDRFLSLLDTNPDSTERKLVMLKENRINILTCASLLDQPEEYLKANINALKERKKDPASFRPLFNLRLKPAEFVGYLDSPKKEVVMMYSFKNEKYFHYLVGRLNPSEVEIFEEVGRRIRENDEISKNEIMELFASRIKYCSPQTARTRLNKILRSLEKDGGLKKREVVVEKKPE
jgi:hypothetical protein